MNELNTRITIIKRKIDKAIRLSTRWINPIRPFGSEDGLKFNPPIELKKLIEIENQYEIKFPEEYRAFITTIANGGSGPAYGLFSLEKSIKISLTFDDKDKYKDHYFKTPFIHTSDFNPHESPYMLKLGNKWKRGEISDKEFYLIYDSIDEYMIAPGTLTICHTGCAHYNFLVVSGKAYGQMWADFSGSDQGYCPLNFSFLDWYEEWLDEHFQE